MLFDPYSIRDLDLPNRIVVSPMCQYSAVDGCPTDWHIVHWGQMLQSGAAMFIIEATGVEPEGRITHGCVGLYDDTTEQALTVKLAQARAQAGGKTIVAMQLGHAGRKASSQLPWEGGQSIPVEQGGWITSAPSAIPHAEGEPAPVALDTAGLARVKQAFVQAAQRAGRAGIDALELHFAHGYLMHQFLSPIANQRTDDYGGSFENRIRYPLEVFEAVRAAWPESKPLGVRVSATDWLGEDDATSWTSAQTVELARRLDALGCDWIDVSSGGVSPKQQIKLAPGYQVPFAQAVKEATDMATFAVGLITDPKQADDIVVRGQADFVALARAMLYDPRWPWHAAAELGGKVSGPVQYMRSLPREAAGIFTTTKVIGSR
ncbi:NADH:flavin oxidoreductase/NADH oxidase [soil metagenome]